MLGSTDAHNLAAIYQASCKTRVLGGGRCSGLALAQKPTNAPLVLGPLKGERSIGPWLAFHQTAVLREIRNPSR